MSKKLLMNNYSENELMPVMDGLVCWLDGRDGSGTERKWKDRSGNENNCFLENNMVFSNTNGWTGYSLLLNGENCGYGELYTMKKIAGNNWTFELKFNNKKYDTGLLDNVNSSKGIGFSVFHSDGKIGLTIKNKESEWKEFPFEFINNNTVTITISENGEVKLYKNGVYLHTVQYNILNGNFPYSANGWRLGCYKESSYGMMGEIFSLRIYNRVLTEKEVQQNYEYEQTIKRGE